MRYIILFFIFSIQAFANWNYTPIDISSATASTYNPQIVKDDASGHAIVTWAQISGSIVTIYSSYSQDYGTNWSTPYQISTYNSLNPKIVMRGKNAVIVFEKRTASNGVIVATYSDDYGASWEPLTLDSELSPPSENARLPEIDADSTGQNVIIAWHTFTQTIPKVFTIRSDDFGKKTTYKNKNNIFTGTISSGGIAYVTLSINKEKATIGWQVGINPNNIWVGRSNDRGASWTGVKFISGNDLGYEPVVKTDSSGNAVALWISKNTTSNNYFVTKSFFNQSTSTWSSPSQITSASNDISYLCLDMNSKNNMVAAFSNSPAPSSSNIQTIYSSDSGLSWSTPINVPNSSDGIFSKVSIDENNFAALAWGEYLGAGKYKVKAAYTEDIENTWTTDPTLLSGDIFNTFTAQHGVVLYSHHKAIVMWSLGTTGSGITQCIRGDFSPAHIVHYVQRNYFDNTSWSSPANVTPSPSENLENLDLAMNDSCKAIAVWDSLESSSIFAKTSFSQDIGHTWGAVKNVSQNASEGFTFPKISLNDSDQSIVVFARKDGSDFRVESYLSESGGDWGDFYTLSDPSSSNLKPQIVLDNSGFAIACFTGENTEPNTKAIGGGHFDHLKINSYQKYIRFLTQGDLTARLTSNYIPYAKEFKIYKDANLTHLIKTIAGNQLNCVLHALKSGESLYITWVNDEGVESNPEVVLIK